jgi:hypothetical protein
MYKLFLRIFYFPLFFTQLSCSINNSPGVGDVQAPVNNFKVDENVFFKITFGGKTISFNQIYHNTNNGSFALNDLLATVSTRTNSDNLTESNFLISLSPYTSNYFHNNGNPSIPWQTCEALINIQKRGDIVGIYDASIPGAYGVITDLSIGVGRKEYQIEGPLNSNNNTLRLEVISIDSKFIVGKLNCVLIDGTNKIPASGSFRLVRTF